MASNKNPFDESAYNRANGISSLSKVLSDNQRRSNKTLAELNKSISTTVKKQKTAIDEVGYSKGMRDIESSMDVILKKLGYTIEEFGRGAKKIVSQTAVATKETLKEYGRAISEDISVNKTNLVAMSLAKSSPIFGYFAAKFMETNVFKKAKENISKSLSSVFTTIINKFKELFTKGKGIFKEWWASGNKMDRFFKGLDKIIKFPFEKVGQLLKFGWESLKFLIKIPWKIFIGTFKMFYNVLIKFPIKSVLAAFKGILWVLKSPFKMVSAILHGFRGKKETSIPKMATGGIVKKEGMVHLHAGEIVAPIGKLMDPLLKSINELRLFLVGPRLLGFLNFYGKALMMPLKWLFRPRGGYFSQIPHFGNVFEKTAITLGLIYTSTQPKLDAMIRILQNIGEAITGEKQPGPSTSTWTKYGSFSEGRILSKLKGKLSTKDELIANHPLLGKLINSVGGKSEKVKEEVSKRYVSVNKKILDQFLKAPPESLNLDLVEGTVSLRTKATVATQLMTEKLTYANAKELAASGYSTGKGLAVEGYSKSKKLYGTGKNLVKERYQKLKQTDIKKTLGESFKSGKEDLKKEWSNLKASEVGQDVGKLKKKTGSWVHKHITGVSVEGLTEALGFVADSFVGIIGAAATGVGYLVVAPFKILTKVLSMGIRTSLMLIRGISHLVHGVWSLTKGIVSLPFNIAFSVATSLTKSLTKGVIGILKKPAQIMQAITKGKGIGGAIGGWWKGLGVEKTGEEVVASENAKEKKKTGIEGELQKIRHSFTEFRAHIDKQWASKQKESGLVAKFKNMVKAAKSGAWEVRKQWHRTVRSYDDMHKMYEELHGLRQDAKKSGIWDFIKSAAAWIWGIGTKIFDAVRGTVTGAGKTVLGGVVGMAGEKVLGGAHEHAKNIPEKFKKTKGFKGKAKLAGKYAAGATGSIMSVMDALSGMENAESWGTSGGSSAIGAALGGTGSGWSGLMEGTIKGATLGFTVGGPWGAGIGAVIGGIFGSIGGENLAKFFDSIWGKIKAFFNFLGVGDAGSIASKAEKAKAAGETGDASQSDYLKKRSYQNLTKITADDVFEGSEYSASKQPGIISRVASKVREVMPKFINKMISNVTGVDVGNAIRSLPDANVNMLEPSVLKSLTGLANDYYKATGKPLTVNSAFRSRAQQEQLYATKPGFAARPGSSLHEYGWAADIHSSDANTADSYGLLDKYGFVRPMAREPWHIQPKGITLAQAKESSVNQTGDPQFSKKSIAQNKVEYYNQMGDWMDQSIKATKDSAGTLSKGFVRMGDIITTISNRSSVQSSNGGNSNNSGFSSNIDNVLRGELT